MSQSELQLVFVYGTLKRGEPNHELMVKTENGQSTFLSLGTTTQKYPLVIGTKYNIPFLLDKPGSGYNVKGEIFKVDEKMLSNLDQLEDHPNFYVRRLEPILSANETLNCWVYFLPTSSPNMLQKQMLESYSSKVHVYTERNNEATLEDLNHF